MECDNFQNYVEYVLLTMTIIETFLSYTPDGYPKSILQTLVFIIYQIYKLVKTPKVEEDVIKPNNELIDIIIK